MHLKNPIASKSQWSIACSAALYGTVTVGGEFFRQLGLSLYEVSLYPLAITFLIVFPFSMKKYATRREMLPFFVSYGFIGALVQLLQFGGIVLGVPIATVSFLLYMQPIWTTLLGKLLLRERITLHKGLAVVLATCGVLVLIQGEGVRGDVSGIFSAILGGVFLALWVIWGRKSGLRRQHYLTATAGWSGSSSAWLLVLWPLFFVMTRNPAMSRLSLSFPLRYWIFLTVFAVVAGVLPSLLFFRGLQTVPASTAGIILLLEPVTASLMAALFFKQPLGLHTVSGGSLILLSNFLLLGEA
jgi:drug/metabolite transporter (DMT)-like permease